MNRIQRIGMISAMALAFASPALACSIMPPPCGQMVGHDAYYGKPGDVFLVYLSGGAQLSVMQAYSLDRIIEPRAIEALTKMPE